MSLTTFTGPVVSQNGFIDSSFTTAERDAIVDPQPGLLIYNTDTNTYEVCTAGGAQPTWDSAFGGGGGGGGFPLYFIFDNSTFTSSSNRGAIAFNPTGTQYVQMEDAAGLSGFKQYNLSTPFDVTSVMNSFSAPFQSLLSPTNVIGGFFNANGTTYTAVQTYDQPGYYGYGRAQTLFLSTPYDVSSANNINSPFDFYTGNSGNDVLKGIAFSEDGTKAIFAKVNVPSSQVWVSVAQLANPFDLTSLGNLVETPLTTYFNSVPGTSNTFSELFGMALNSSGTVAFFTSYNFAYNLSYAIELKLDTAYDFSTVSATHYQNLGLGYSSSRGQITVANGNQASYVLYSSMAGLAFQQYELASLSAPNITGVSPSSGASGTSVTLTGTGFTGTSQVLFGGFGSSFTVNSDTQITVTVPSGSGTVDITVENVAGSSTEVGGFTYTGSAQTTYQQIVNYYGGGITFQGGGSGSFITVNRNLWFDPNQADNLTSKGSGTAFSVTIDGYGTYTITSYSNWDSIGPGESRTAGFSSISPGTIPTGTNITSISFNS